MIQISSVFVNGAATQLVPSNPDRVALLFFSYDGNGIPISPADGMTDNGGMFQLQLQRPLIVRLRDYGTLIGREFWCITTAICHINCIEIINH